MLNYVFYSLLMTRSVYDSSSKQSFHLGKRRWDFFVELQAFLSPTNDLQRETRKKLSQFIPILAHCSSIRESLPLFEIDEETRRVCTYLRAYDNGTIDRKFQKHEPKQVIFVVDESGSMTCS